MPALVEPSSIVRPPVEWAQRKDVLLVTVKVEDCLEPKYEFTDDALHVTGTGGRDKRPFDGSIQFYKEIDPSKARLIPSDRCVHFVIPKKESGPFWPRLLKSDKKVHWLKVDFDKWRDEDELSDFDESNFDLNDMMGKMGGFGDGKPALDDLDDSDEGELPDLEDEKGQSKEAAKEDSEEGESNEKTTTTTPAESN